MHINSIVDVSSDGGWGMAGHAGVGNCSAWGTK